MRAATPPDIAGLMAEGVAVHRMGEARARFAYPGLDAMKPVDAFVAGYQDGARAVLGMVEGLALGVLDVRELLARLCDPDVLPRG